MKKNKKIYTFIVCLISFNLFAQVGINTDTPSDASILDIASSDKGVLIPRINITDLSTAAPITGTISNGLLVYNTNTSTGEGFYYWNGSSWSPFVDADFLDVATSAPPGSNASPIYSTGNVNIGSTSDHGFPLHVELPNSSSTLDSAVRINRNTSHTSSSNYVNGLSIFGNNSNSGEYRGLFIYNQGSGTGKVVGNITFTTSTSTGNVLGSTNELYTSGNSTDFGIYNFMAGTGNGWHFGIYNQISSTATGTGNKYGSYNFVSPSAGGTHYGVYSQATKANSYAGMFVGRLGISSSSGLTDRYTFPSSRGSQGQVLTLVDNVGTLGWGNSSRNSTGLITEVSSNYTLTSTDLTVIAYNSVTEFVIPDAALNTNKIYKLMSAHNNNNPITLSSLGGVIRNPLTNTVYSTLTTGQRIEIQSTGTYWAVIDEN